MDEESDSDDDYEDDNVDNSDDNFADDTLQDLSDVDLEDIDNEDLSDIEFNDDSKEGSNSPDDELISDLNRKLRKRKSSKDRSREKKKGKEIDNIFISAEKFAEMLEEQSKARDRHGGSNAFSSSDGASSKQIDWEMKRNLRLKRSFGRNKRKHTVLASNNNNKRIKKLKR